MTAPGRPGEASGSGGSGGAVTVDGLGPPTGGDAAVMRSSAVMAAGTAVSRVLGFARAAVLVWAVGASTASADAFDIANTVPNNIYMLLAGGVLNAVLVPQVARAARGPDGGTAYVNRLLTLSMVGLAAITVLVTAAAPLLVALYAGAGWDRDLVMLSAAFAFWCLPQVFFYGLYALVGQVLNARGSFGPYMWAPALNNVVSICGLLVFVAVAGSAGDGGRDVQAWSPGLIALLAGTATAGIAAQALVLWIPLRRSGFRYRPSWGLRGSGLRRAGTVAGWTFAAVVVGQLGFVVTSQVAATGGDLARAVADADVTPSKATYTQAFLLFMLPHSLVAVSLVTALFTQMSHAASAGSTARVRADLSLGLRTVSVATIPAAVAFWALGPDLTRALYVGSSPSDTRAIAYVAMAMIVGLVPFSASYLVQRVFYAYEDARTPFLIQLPVVAVMTLGNLAALWWAPPQWIVVGVGASASLSHLVGLGLGLFLVHRRVGGFDGHRVLRTHVRLLIAGVGSGVVAWGVARVLHLLLADSLGQGSWPLAVVTGGIGGVVLLGTYIGFCRLLRVEELRALTGPLVAVGRRLIRR